MAKYLMSILNREGSAHIFVTVLLYKLTFYNFYAYTCMLLVLFFVVDKWFINLFKRAPRKIGTANWVTLGKLSILTYLLYLLSYN